MVTRKILVLSPLPEQVVLALLKAKASSELVMQVEVISYRGGSKKELIESAREADIILGDYTFNTAIDADVLRSASRCVLIQQPSTGYQHIDVREAAVLGIPVANTAGANTVSVAEHTVMLILACLKKLILAHKKTISGEWAQDEMANHGVFELHHKTVGIIGAGRIGVEVAKRLKPFGANMIYYDVNHLSADTCVDYELSFRPLDALIAESDIITIHTPLTVETENLISEGRIARMKPGAVLINVSRGSIVDEAALAMALKDGRLQGAALDVFSTEPIGPANPLLDAPNVVLTPHVAGATNESRWRIINMSLDNIVSVLGGGVPVNIVNGVEPGSR